MYRHTEQVLFNLQVWFEDKFPSCPKLNTTILSSQNKVAVTDVRILDMFYIKCELQIRASQEKSIKCNISRADIIKEEKNIKAKKYFDVVWNSGSSKYNIDGLYSFSKFFFHS